ncbi:aldo/keto reductase [Oleiharenicola lentus]|uniref:aldo/keto reductase n=1 Tax=Oleiharenicola lentus TaxID=2508720 RepID=UPI003F663CE6
MKYRSLGRTGLKVSEVSLGTWAFGSPSIYGAVDSGDANRAIRGALDAGINFFDTAPLYGTKEADGIAEEVLGKALGADRDKVTIATKFGRYHSRVHTNELFDGETVKWSVEQSLKRLGTDRLDVLFFHSPTHPDKIRDDVWTALDALKRSGKVRFVGTSTGFIKDTGEMSKSWAVQGRIDVAQIAYSLTYREWEPIIADLGRQGVGIVARESLANGFLAGVFTKEIQFPAGSLNSRYSREEIVERVELADRYKALLVRNDVRSLAAAAMRWVLDNPNISTVLSGSKKLEEILDCAGASDAAPYSTAELAQAETLHTKDFSPA